MIIWNKPVECAARSKITTLQSQRLMSLIRTLVAKNPVYKKKCVDLGIKSSAIRHINDIKKLPFTLKEDLRDGYPFGLFTDFKNTCLLYTSPSPRD